jgi:predicted PurR-regulated permease PerM
LFYLLTAGRQGLRTWITYMPMAPKYRDYLAERIVSTIRATVKGTFIIAVIQGSLTGLALAVAGVPGAAFWGAVAGILSIIPGVGPPLVWLPAAIWLYATGQTIPAIGLTAWGALVVGLIDNLLRPILVGKDAKMTDLMVLLSTLGGLTLFGAIGIIVGPVIAAVFTSVWYIYSESYEQLLDNSEN